MSAASHRISRLEPYLDRAEPAPTLLKMLVGVQLAGFREDAGLSQDQAARALGFSAAKLSRIESGKGRRPPSETDVRALLEHYDTDPYEASVLLKLLQRAGEPGWWQRYDKRLMPEWFDRLVGLQEAAATIRTFEIQYVPGLLQTEAYTDAVVRRGLPNAPASEVGRRVELRKRRAQLLDRKDAPQLWAIIDESVLLRVLGSREVMREQLAHRRDGEAAPCDAADRAAGRDERVGARDPRHLPAFRWHQPAGRGLPGAHQERQLPGGPGRDRRVRRALVRATGPAGVSADAPVRRTRSTRRSADAAPPRCPGARWRPPRAPAPGCPCRRRVPRRPWAPAPGPSGPASPGP